MMEFKMMRPILYSVMLIVMVACGGGGGGGNPAGKTWSAPERISLNGDTSAPEIATDAAGNAFAIFQDADTTDWGTFANKYSVGSGWGQAERINTSPAFTNVSTVDIAVAPDGETVAVWTQDPASFIDDAWYNRLDPGSAWGSPFLLESVSTQIRRTQVVLDTQGTGTAVYIQNVSSGSDNLVVRNYISGGWFAPLVIDVQSTSIRNIPRIVADSSGRVYVAWSQDVASGTSLYASFSAGPTSATWTTELVDVLSPPALRPDIAVNSSGTAFLVWDQVEVAGNALKIWARRRPNSSVAGVWETPVRLDTDTVSDASNARIAVDSNGDAIAVWQQSDGLRNNIWTNRYREDASSWGSAQLLETADGSASDPRLSIRNNGEAFAVWIQNDGNDLRVWSAHFEPGIGWNSPVRLENDVGKNAFSPTIAFDPSGNAFAAWLLLDPASGDDIWASQYR